MKKQMQILDGGVPKSKTQWTASVTEWRDRKNY